MATPSGNVSRTGNRSPGRGLRRRLRLVAGRRQDRPDGRAVEQVPEADLAVPAPGADGLAVGGQGQAVDPVVVAGEGGLGGEVLEGPDDLVGPAGQHRLA